MNAKLADTVEEWVSDYSPQKEQPLPEYTGLLCIYTAIVSGALLLLKNRNREFVPRITPFELLMLALGTHKLSRIITLDKVTSPLRATFTQYEKDSGEGEVQEKPRGDRVRRVAGEFLSCPYCLGVWIATAFSIGRGFAPQITRFFAEIFALTAVSDFLHRGYAATKRID